MNQVGRYLYLKGLRGKEIYEDMFETLRMSVVRIQA